MLLNLLPLVGLLSLTLAAPQALTQTTPYSPPLGTTGGIIEASTGDTKIFTQTSNGAINVISGSGPNTGSNYKGAQAIDGGIAKIGTPIAVVGLNNQFAQMRLYFIGTDDKLKEYIFYASTNKWTPGDLTSMNYGTAVGSKILYAAIDSREQSRVGFVRTEGILTEAYNSDQSSGAGWHYVDY